MKDQKEYYRLIKRREMLINMMGILEDIATPKALSELKRLKEAYDQVEIDLEEVTW